MPLSARGMRIQKIRHRWSGNRQAHPTRRQHGRRRAQPWERSPHAHAQRHDAASV